MSKPTPSAESRIALDKGVEDTQPFLEAADETLHSTSEKPARSKSTRTKSQAAPDLGSSDQSQADGDEPPRQRTVEEILRPKRGRPRKLKPVNLAALTDGVVTALAAAGGANYLLAIARDDPKTFCALLARVLPGRLEGTAKAKTGIALRWGNTKGGAVSDTQTTDGEAGSK